jgi:hypothetical protein
MKATKFRTVGWIATAALLTAALVAPGVASANDQNPGQVADLPISYDHEDYQGDEEKCAADIEAWGVGEGQAYWHFVQTQVDEAVLTGELTAEFEDEGEVTVDSYKKAGGSLHWHIITGLDSLVSVSSDVESDGNLNLSHICWVPEPEPTPTPDPTATPDGGVEDTTDPSLPPTSTLTGKSGTSDTWRTMLLVLAAVLATTLVLTPARSSRKR